MLICVCVRVRARTRSYNTKPVKKTIHCSFIVLLIFFYNNPQKSRIVDPIMDWMTQRKTSGQFGLSSSMKPWIPVFCDAGKGYSVPSLTLPILPTPCFSQRSGACCTLQEGQYEECRMCTNRLLRQQLVPPFSSTAKHILDTSVRTSCNRSTFSPRNEFSVCLTLGC